jgi:hypothetical protein
LDCFDTANDDTGTFNGRPNFETANIVEPCFEAISFGHRKIHQISDFESKENQR